MQEDVAAAAQRLLDALRACVLLALPLLTRGPGGRPPIDDADVEAVLKNERRKRIYELIQQRPGISPIEIKNALDLGGGVLDNHIDRLIRAALIETRRSGKFLRLYPTGTAPAEDDPTLLPATTKEVARAVLRQPGRTTAEIAKELGLTQRRVNMQLHILVVAGLIRSVPAGYEHRHEPTERLREVVDRW